MWSVPSVADEFKPALLEITETEPGWYSVTWKVPTRAGQPLSIAPVLPVGLERVGPASIRTAQGDVIEQSVWRSSSGALVGGTIEIDGLSAWPIDVIVQIDLVDGSEHSAILRPASPTFVVPERATKWTVAASYWKIGTIHILEGYSVSLALATLGVVNMPGPPTEAVIALSILFMAVEIVHKHQGRMTLTERKPWVIALAFGLVHGLGFAGALAEVGLPQQDIPLALLMFNLGVETGQILFVCFVLLVIALIKRLPVRWPQHSWRLMPYAIGGIAAFWTVERVISFV